MKKLVVTTAALALAAGLASTAFASQQDGGFYVGVKGGYNKMDIVTGNFTVTDSDGSYNMNGKEDKYMLNAHVGYLFPVADQFFLGPQLGYSYYGKYKLNNNPADSENGKIEYYSINLSLVGQYNIEDWFVQGRVGAGRFHGKSSDNVTNADTTTKNKWRALAGVSGGYFFTENFSAEIFYDHVFGSNIKAGDFANGSGNSGFPTMNSVGIGLTYSF